MTRLERLYTKYWEAVETCSEDTSCTGQISLDSAVSSAGTIDCAWTDVAQTTCAAPASHFSILSGLLNKKMQNFPRVSVIVLCQKSRNNAKMTGL